MDSILGDLKFVVGALKKFENVFMHHLPKIILDESGKLTIYFTAKPDGEQQYMKNDYFHVSWYYAEKPCLNKRDLKNMSQEDINEYYLGVIVDTLRHIARINNRALELDDIIDETVRKVRENQIFIQDIPGQAIQGKWLQTCQLSGRNVLCGNNR